MIIEIIDEINKNEQSGIQKIHETEEKTQKKIDAAKLISKEKIEQALHEITREFERSLIQEEEKNLFHLKTSKHETEKKCLELRKNSQLNIDKTIEYLEKKIYTIYK